LAAATCALTGILLQPGVARAATAVNTAVVGVAAAPDASPSDDRRFDVLEYRVLGNKSLDVATVERAVYAHLGPGLGIADVEAARTSVEQAYRTAGFGTVYVDIPEQDIERGIVRLKVT